jgi:hypothetical protein
MADETTESARPQLRIVRGDPTAEELAVVTALVAAAGADGGKESTSTPQRGRWADPFDQHRRPWQSGQGGWRAALRP